MVVDQLVLFVVDSTSKLSFGIIFLARHIPSWLHVSCFVVVVVVVVVVFYPSYIATEAKTRL